MSVSDTQRLHEMIERWVQIASQVEHGYPLTFDDYLNDLDLRRLIDERIRTLSNSTSDEIPEALSDVLTAADDRFRDATTVSTENVWGADNERDEGWTAEQEWYYYRWPKRTLNW